MKSSLVEIIVEPGDGFLDLMIGEHSVSPEVLVGLESGDLTGGADVFFVGHPSQERVPE